MRVIHDGNWQDVVREHEYATGTRFPGALPRQTNPGGLKCAKLYEEVMPTIPESEWPARVRFAIDNGMFPSAHLRKAKPNYTPTQNGLNYCWAWSLASTMSVRNLALGKPWLEYAPVTLGGDVNFRNAGNYLDSAIAYAAKNGIAEASFVPNQHSLSPSTYKPGWKENALLNRPTEWFDSDNNPWPNTVSALLSGFAEYVGLDWWSHAVCYVGLTFVDDEICPEVLNSHNDGIIVLKGSRKIPSLGSFAYRLGTW